MTVSFTLNGQPACVIAPPFASLAETLREELGLTGTKIGCEAGDCGACTVLLDGAQVCACLVPTAQAEGAAIDTVEGEGPDGAARPPARGVPRPRRRAVRHLHARHADGRRRPPLAPARAGPRQVEDAIGGVLCRCTGYLKIVEAVLEVRRSIRPQLQPRGELSLPRT